jgi:CRP/FNR family cyclic AMP-dependent transcriptional regulator
MPLFCDLSDGEISRVRGLLHGTVLSAHTNVLTVDQPGEVVYILVSGTVKIHAEQVDGTDVILAILGPGAVVGEMSVVDTLSRSATVQTMEESTLLWIDRASFWECLRTMPQLGVNLLRLFAGRMRMSNAQIQALAALDVYGRVARQLLVLADEYGERRTDGTIHLPLRLTQSDFAGLIGASRARVNKVLGEFREWGYIRTDANQRMTLLDVQGLKSYFE